MKETAIYEAILSLRDRWADSTERLIEVDTKNKVFVLATANGYQTMKYRLSTNSRGVRQLHAFNHQIKLI